MTAPDATTDATTDATLDALFGARTQTIVDDAIPPALAADVRGRLARTGYTRFALYDRGSYDELVAPDEPRLLAIMIDHAARTTPRTLTLAHVRVLRFAPGDYSLAHHDHVHEGHPLEVTIDLSPRPVRGAEVHYRRRGQVYFRVPCTPGALSIVERGPTVTSNHTYVSRRDAGAEVIRLIALLRDA